MSGSGPAPSPTETTVMGIDGCRGGWVVVTWGPDGHDAFFAEELTAQLAQLRSGEIAAIAIDMPIGLLEDRPRACDIEARKILGPRKSSVFPAPLRSTLAATDYANACELSRAASGKALSKQAFNLLPKIAELDELVRPDDQDRLVEAHPECAFVRLSGEPLEHPKRTEPGRATRRRLLTGCDPIFGDLLESYPELPALDLIDASVLTVTARHVVAGTEHRLGGEIDATGLAATVVY